VVLISMNGRWRDYYRFGEFIMIVLLRYQVHTIILFYDKILKYILMCQEENKSYSESHYKHDVE